MLRSLYGNGTNCDNVSRSSFWPLTIVALTAICFLFSQQLLGQSVIDRHKTVRGVADGLQIGVRLLDNFVLDRQIKRDLEKQEGRIIKLLSNDNVQGVLVLSEVHIGLYSRSRRLTGTYLIGSGDTPIDVLREYSQSSGHVKGIPGKTWKRDLDSTTYHWYTQDHGAELRKWHLPSTVMLEAQVKQQLENERSPVNSNIVGGGPNQISPVGPQIGSDWTQERRWNELLNSMHWRPESPPIVQPRLSVPSPLAEPPAMIQPQPLPVPIPRGGGGKSDDEDILIYMK